MRNFHSAPFPVNSLAPLEVGSIPFLSLHPETCSHSQASIYCTRFYMREVEHAPKGRDNTISIVYPGSGAAIHTVRMSTLPLVTLMWASIVAAGHDCEPYTFSGNQAGWRLTGSLDDTSAPKSTLSPSRFDSGGPGRLKSAAFNAFKNADSRGFFGRGAGSSSQGELELLTVHQNTITNVRPYEGQSEAVTKVSTTGADGNLSSAGCLRGWTINSKLQRRWWRSGRPIVGTGRSYRSD